MEPRRSDKVLWVLIRVLCTMGSTALLVCFAYEYRKRTANRDVSSSSCIIHLISFVRYALLYNTPTRPVNLTDARLHILNHIGTAVSFFNTQGMLISSNVDEILHVSKLCILWHGSYLIQWWINYYLCTIRNMRFPRSYCNFDSSRCGLSSTSSRKRWYSRCGVESMKSELQISFCGWTLGIWWWLIK